MKKVDFWLKVLAVTFALGILTAIHSWSVNVPLKVDLQGPFGRTCDQVTLEVRAFGAVIYSLPYTNLDELNATLSLGPDTNWTVIVAVRADVTSDSLVTWVFQYNYWFSGGTRLFTTPAYWNFGTDSVRMNYTVNGNTLGLSTRTGVQSFDTNFSVVPYNQYSVIYEIFPSGQTRSLNWVWNLWGDTTGGQPSGPTPPTQANLCAVTGTVIGVDGIYIPYADVRFDLPDRVYDSCTGAFVGVRSVSTRTDANGRFTKNLIKSVCLGGTRYKMTVKKGGNTMVERIITVPNTSTYTVSFP